MSLRHPPRFPIDPEASIDRYGFDRDAFDRYEREVNRRPLPELPLLQPAEAASRKRFSDGLVVHPFATDFGPKTLTRFLRDEIVKLQSSIRSVKGKDKERASQNAVNTTECRWERSSNNSDDAYHSTALDEIKDEMNRMAPTVAPQLQLITHTAGSRRSLLSNAPDPTRRRSERLARREQSQVLGGVGAASSDIAELSQADSRPSHDEDLFGSSSGGTNRRVHTIRRGGRQARPIQPSSTSSTNGRSTTRSHLFETELPRRVNFEEHTTNRRRAVRNIAIEESTDALDNGWDLLRPTSRSRTVDDLPRSSTSLPDTSPGRSYFGFTSIRRPSLPSQARVETPSRSRRPDDERTVSSPKSTVPTESKGKLASNGHSGGGSAAAASEPEILDVLDTMFINMRQRDNGSSSLGTVAVDDTGKASRHPPHFNYSYTVPERVSDRLKTDFLLDVRQVTGTTETVDSLLMQAVNAAASPNAPDEAFPAAYKLSSSSTSSTEGPGQECSGNIIVSPPGNEKVGLASFDADIWMTVAKFLSTEDIKSIRLVNQTLSQLLAPIQFRNIVVNFDKSFFNVNEAAWDTKSGHPPSNSMLKKYGGVINQFGIAFEYDLPGLTYAEDKIIEKEQVAWFGRFLWPTEQYPRYPRLQGIEDLVDHNRPLLKEAFKHVTKSSELGLCIDSGHGWLEGADISDMALFDRRMNKGSKVFGKTFSTEDVWASFSRNQYFKWAQQNTINEAINQLKERAFSQESAAKDVDFLEKLEVRDLDSFQRQDQQVDARAGAHVGVFSHDPIPGGEIYYDPMLGQDRSSACARTQWPLIFNGYNLAAHLGGHTPTMQNKTANPILSPLLPGNLTEAQAQWLMETVWAQRAFLSAYTTAVITNKQNFQSIHTLRISKLSSGLLPSLEQREFWKSLPSLKALQMFVSPDWRQEYVIGDRSYATNMLISPVKAAQKFTQFLRTHIAKIESLHSLTIGYVGGGEHAVGMFARNQHVLPAPIVDDPRDWLRGANHGGDPVAMTKFDHIRDLKFENCWFTPWMLQGFMNQSRDTSLHSLTLESVSMVPYHEYGLDRRLTTLSSNLHCLHGPDAWLQEALPTGAAWCRVLDIITPGKTLVDRQYDAGILNEDDQPRPKRSFRGHIRKITLKSCGYVRITQPKSTLAGFNQNAAVSHVCPSMDKGIHQRKARFDKSFPSAYAEENETVGTNPRPRQSRDRYDEASQNRIMLGICPPGGEVHPWLGTLTQCVHPVEKRVLERAWGMTFGWGDDMARWGAVEDGFFEGGTGRFSGVIEKDGDGEGHGNDEY